MIFGYELADFILVTAGFLIVIGLALYLLKSR
jgi:hypothetical protein